jgi:hypothetical protein
VTSSWKDVEREKSSSMPVVDASIVIEWISPEADNSSPALRLFNRLAAEGNELLAPRLLLEEVSNALVSEIRRTMERSSRRRGPCAAPPAAGPHRRRPSRPGQGLGASAPL